MSYTDEYIDVKGGRLHCLRWGSDRDRAFLIIHGNSHCGGVYAPLGEALAADGSTVVAMDLRGHGRSDKPESGYDWQSLCDDGVAVIESLDLRNVVLIGHSRGAATSLLVASALPGRVSGVVVHEPTIPHRDASGAFIGRSMEVVSANAERALARRTTFSTRDDALSHFRTRDNLRDWRQDYLDAYVDHGTVATADGGLELACPPWVQAKLFEALLNVDAWKSVGRADLPVLVTYGDKTGRGAGPEPASVTQMFAEARSVVMPDATHSGPMEHPDFFEARVREMAAQVHPRVGNRA